MVQKQDGSALLLVLLMTVVLTVLALALVGNTLNDAKQTSFREDDVVTIHEAQRSIEEAIALINATFNYQGAEQIRTIDQHNETINDLISAFNIDESGNFTFNEQPSNFMIEKGDAPFDETRDFSRDFVIITQAKDTNGRIIEFRQKIYLSAIPSFLYYAMGSRSNLFLNGAATIKGNVYTKDGLKIKDSANYIFSGSKVLESTYPYLEGELVIHDPSKRFMIEETPYFLNNSTIDLFHSISGSNVTIGEVDFFNDVNINKTYLDKFNEVAQTNWSSLAQIDYNLLTGTLFKINPIDYFEFDEDDEEFNEYYDQFMITGCSCSGVYNGNLTIEKNVEIPEGQWLIVDGDLLIQPLDTLSGLTIDGNILVNGDVTVIGKNLKFDSAIFSLGNAFFYNSSIEGITSDSSLILFSTNGLEVTRINEFEEFQSNNIINAFLYTESSATMYGVGSKVIINGGIFAEGDLTVNAVRGEVEKGTSTIYYPSGQQIQANIHANESRFYVTHNPEILTPAYSEKSKSYSGLPRTNNFTIILDRRDFNRK